MKMAENGRGAVFAMELAQKTKMAGRIGVRKYAVPWTAMARPSVGKFQIV
jgi:hypothetical protein